MASASPRLVLVALLCLYLIWGSTYLAIIVALETLRPFTLGALRYFIAGGILYGALRFAGAPAPTAREWRASLVTGTFMGLFGNGFVVLGQQWVSSGLVALVVGTMPLWAALFGIVLRPSAPELSRGPSAARREWFGLGLGFLGISLLQFGGELSSAGLGAVLILLSPICWALGGVLGRRLPLPAGPMASATQLLTGGVGFLVAASFAGDPFPVAPSLRSLLALAYLILFGSIVGFTAYAYLLRRTRLAVANSYAYVNPVVAILLGATLAGETVSTLTGLAAAVILAAVAIINWRASDGAARRGGMATPRVA